MAPGAEYWISRSRQAKERALASAAQDVRDRCHLGDGGELGRRGRRGAQDGEDEQHLHPGVDRQEQATCRPRNMKASRGSGH